MRTAAQTALIMAILTLLSKGFGFIREMIMANYYGTSYITDAYVMAIAIPGIIFGGVLTAVSVAYMPLLSSTIEQQGERKANEFTSGVLNILTIVAILSGIIGFVFSDQIIAIFASGFTGKTAELASSFVKITFFYLIFSATAEILEAFLRYKGIFIPQVAFGFLQNFILIGAIIISTITSYYYLIYGYLLVYLFRFLIMITIAKKYEFKYYSKVKINDTIKQIVLLSLPVFVGSSVAQINLFVDKTLASGLPEGSVSALNYGNLLVALISGITISIMTTIIYPKLTQASAVNDAKRITNIVETGINLILMVAIPCTLGAMLYSKQIVQIVYERGAFDLAATSMTSTAFFYYVIGMTFGSLVILLTQVCYAKQNMKTPMVWGGIGVIMNVVLNLILIGPMAHGGLALASSIASVTVSIFLYFSLRRQYPEVKAAHCYGKAKKITIAAFVSVGASYLFYQFVVLALSDVIVARFAQLMIAVLVAGIVYPVLLYLLKIEELNLVLDLIKRKK